MIALVFIFLHIATLRWRWNLFGWFTPFYATGPDGTPLAHATTALALQSNLVLVLYIVGVLSVVYHWCNGLWTAAISWGLTISVPAQRRWGYACAGLGVLLTVFSAGAIVGARTYEVTPAEQAAYDRSVHAQIHGDPGRESAVLAPRMTPGASATVEPQAVQTH